jgi:sigma-B regulation protein RsbU (phosphoserine phosphatase)
MATFQASLHTLIGASETLADLAAGLNGYAMAHSQGGRRFTTAFFAAYDAASRTVAYINAGHNAPILKRANGNFECLNATGLPLGVPSPAQAPAGYAEKCLQLDPGDTLLVYTDGLVEAENAQGVEFGEERLLAALRAPVKETSALMLERLLAEVDRFAGETHQLDDITCLVFQCM